MKKMEAQNNKENKMSLASLKAKIASGEITFNLSKRSPKTEALSKKIRKALTIPESLYRKRMTI